jgi:hypothetical protein
MNKEIACIIIIFFMIVIGVIVVWKGINNKADMLCYNLHLVECQNCHLQNLTFLLCSGFCSEPIEEDKEIFCAIHPTENCFNIPKECLIK